MYKFDLESSKYKLILGGIILLFVLVICHAFSYLPENEKPDVVLEEININNQSEIVTKKVEEESSNTTDDIEQNEEVSEDTITTSKKEITPLEIISEEELVEIASKDNANEIENNEISFDSFFEKAQGLKKKHSFDEAIQYYQKAFNYAKTAEERAICFEEIAISYASLKRYGSALVNAQKAYNIKPTTTREVLLARLHYKTGNIEQALEKAQSVMKRDFINE